MLRGYSFRPRLWAAALAAAACAAGIALGSWQWDRAVEKRAAAANPERVALRGRLLERHTVLLDNKLYRGRPGYYVVQPLQVSVEAAGKARHVLVIRGWIEAGSRRDVLPQVRTPAGEVLIEGIRTEHFARVYDAGGAPAGTVWQNVTPEAFAARSGLSVEPYLIEQHSPADDGLVREWPRHGTAIETHESYALQWYSLAALALVLLIVLSVKRHAPPAG